MEYDWRKIILLSYSSRNANVTHLFQIFLRDFLLSFLLLLC